MALLNSWSFCNFFFRKKTEWPTTLENQTELLKYISKIVIKGVDLTTGLPQLQIDVKKSNLTNFSVIITFTTKIELSDVV